MPNLGKKIEFEVIDKQSKNDKNNIENGVIEGFKQYDVEVIKWSQRNDEKVTKLLSA